MSTKPLAPMDASPSIHYREFAPSALLSPFVRRHLHGYSIESGPVRLPMPPSRGLFLSDVAGDPVTVRVGENLEHQRFRLFLGGQLRRECPILQCRGRLDLLGVEFTPTGFYRLFKRNASQFTDAFRDFRDIAGAEAVNLEAALAPAGGIEARIAAIENYLISLSSAALPTPVDEAVALIDAHRGTLALDAVAELCGFTPRQLCHVFSRIVGVPPKHYSKIVQINAVVGALRDGYHETLGSLALDCGYFDQAHFIRDFRRFIGANPSAFLASDERFIRTYLGHAVELA